MNYISIEFTFKFEYQTRFSGKFMIQYFITLGHVNINEFFSMSCHVMTVLIEIHDSYHDLKHEP